MPLRVGRATFGGGMHVDAHCVSSSVSGSGHISFLPPPPPPPCIYFGFQANLARHRMNKKKWEEAGGGGRLAVIVCLQQTGSRRHPGSTALSCLPHLEAGASPG